MTQYIEIIVFFRFLSFWISSIGPIPEISMKNNPENMVQTRLKAMTSYSLCAFSKQKKNPQFLKNYFILVLIFIFYCTIKYLCGFDTMCLYSVSRQPSSWSKNSLSPPMTLMNSQSLPQALLVALWYESEHWSGWASRQEKHDPWLFTAFNSDMKV